MASTLIWTSATAAGANGATNPISTIGLGNVSVTITPSGTVTAGTVTFEATNDGGLTWWALTLTQAASPSTGATTSVLTSPVAWQGMVGPWDQFRCRLSTAITGSGTVTLTVET